VGFGDVYKRQVVNSVVASNTAIFANARYKFEGALITGASQVGPRTVELRIQYVLEGATQPTELIETRTVWLVPLWVVIVAGMLFVSGLVAFGRSTFRGRRRAPDRAPEQARDGAEEAGVVDATADSVAARGRHEPSDQLSPDARPLRTAGRAGGGHRLSGKERRALEEERRRRRERRAAEAEYGPDSARHGEAGGTEDPR
jgi:hypothetical protein